MQKIEFAFLSTSVPLLAILLQKSRFSQLGLPKCRPYWEPGELPEANIMSIEIRKQVTDEILKAMKRGLVPWQKPWLGHRNDGPPTNVFTKLSFCGSNRILLELVGRREGFKSKWWGTQRAWTAVGFQIKPHQQGTQVFYGKVQCQMVFNAEQVHGPGVERYLVVDAAEEFHPAFDAADKVIAATKADIRHIHGDEATYFRPPEDYIVVPLKSQFVNGPGGLPGFFATLFHELVHQSEYRLGWHADADLPLKER